LSAKGGFEPEFRTARSGDLAGLFDALPGGGLACPAGLRITGITTSTDAISAGNLFVAIRGTRYDGHEFLREAVAGGAVALLVEEEPLENLGVPVFRVPDTRLAITGLAAAWYGFPARALRLVGITGTLGKTSVLKLLEGMLKADDQSIGTIGTLGVSAGEKEEATGYTAPDPMLLHGALATIVESGCAIAAMEVTSHALDQDRVAGLRFELGVFTNLVPLEHSDYHGSFRSYVQAKRRFLDHLVSDAPLVFGYDDRIVRNLVRAHTGPLIGCGQGPHALVGMERIRVDSEGSRFDVVIRSELPILGGNSLPPMRLPLWTRLLGRTSLSNATLAAAAALSLGARPEAIQKALADAQPLRRRMELIDFGSFWVLDDGASHPDSVSALFEVLEEFPADRVQAVFAIRGQRGARINRRNAEALAIWAHRRPLDRLILTRSEDAVNDLDRVEAEERDAFGSSLRRAGIVFEEAATLDSALAAVLEQVQAGDLVLLLGTQGMDEGAERLRRLLRRGETKVRSEVPPG